MSATIQKLFDDFDVRLLGVDSGLRFLMDTPFEEYAEVEQREQDIRGTVGKVLLEGCEVKWGKTTPCDHQADIADLQLGKALPVSDRVMAFDPLTATARRTFCVDNSQLMIQGEKDTPCITSLVVTEGGQLIMADMTNSKSTELMMMMMMMMMMTYGRL
nr:hypothetical protein BaRGS_031491 [Batillaria attramentaria]